MNRNPVVLIVAILLAVVSLAHLLRIAFAIPVTVADAVIPMWVSGIGVVVPGVLAWLLYRGSR
jgi:protein-S-isoprenylcysteine O-methyltransferase Ste14